MQKINEQRIYSNYKRNLKFLGIIDYQSLVVIVIYIIAIISILKILPLSIELTIYIFMFMVIPVIAIFCININNESTIEVLIIIIKFILNKKIFVKLEYTKDFKPCKYSITKNKTIKSLYNK